MAAESTLKIVFEMSNGNSHTVSLKDPKNGITMSEVTSFANLCVTKNAIKKNHATAANLEDAYIQRVERVEIA